MQREKSVTVVHTVRLNELERITRNSATADKPHDTFVQRAVAWLTP